MERTATRSGTEKRQRTRLRQVRLTPAEDAELARRAAAAGLDVAAYLRQQGLDTPGPRVVRRRPITPELVALTELRLQLGYIGNNLNQLTRLANMGDLDRPDELDRVLAAIMALLIQARTAGGGADA